MAGQDSRFHRRCECGSTLKGNNGADAYAGSDTSLDRNYATRQGPANGSMGMDRGLDRESFLAQPAFQEPASFIYHHSLRWEIVEICSRTGASVFFKTHYSAITTPPPEANSLITN